jgi:RNA recognition motif-containing protein
VATTFFSLMAPGIVISEFAPPKEKRTMKKIFVGNMDRAVTEPVIRSLFETYGAVERVTMVSDEAGHPKGFGFIEMTDDDGAGKAIAAMHGCELNGKVLTVSEARSKGAARSGGRRSE